MLPFHVHFKLTKFQNSLNVIPFIVFLVKSDELLDIIFSLLLYYGCGESVMTCDINVPFTVTLLQFFSSFDHCWWILLLCPNLEKGNWQNEIDCVIVWTRHFWNIKFSLPMHKPLALLKVSHLLMVMHWSALCVKLLRR